MCYAEPTHAPAEGDDLVALIERVSDMKTNLRIKRNDQAVTVTPDGGEWMLSICEHGARLFKPVTFENDDGTPGHGWMEAELVDALDRDDRAFIDAFYNAHYPELNAPQ